MADLDVQLRRTQAAYQAAFAHAEQLRQQRGRLIAQALEEGWTHAQIARAAGITRSRIGQMFPPQKKDTAGSSSLSGEVSGESSIRAS
jgi:hypothetical protein